MTGLARSEAAAAAVSAPGAEVRRGDLDDLDGLRAVAARDIATAIGHGLDLPVTALPAERAGDNCGWIGAFFAADAPASSAATRRLLGWKPTHPGLIADLNAGAYFPR